MSDQPTPYRDIPLFWVEHGDPRIHYANQIMATFQPDEFILSFGQLTPPAVTGVTEDERQAQIDTIGAIPVHILSKVVVNRQRLGEISTVLQQVLENHDKMAES